MKTILLFAPYTEFHAFNKFNSMIPQFKEGYDQAVAVCPYSFACIMTNADKIICASTDYLARTESQYPDVLDRMGHMERYDYGYGHSGFMQLAAHFAERKYGDIDMLLWSDDTGFERRPYVPAQAKIYNGQEYGGDLGKFIMADFARLAKNVKDGYTILPFETDQAAMRQRYPMIDDNTYIYLTRNFKRKQPDYYNSTDVDKSNIERILKMGFKVVNLGCSCMHYDIANPNYFEISANTSYSEQLCICYMGRGLFLRGDSGGFSTHACTALDLFMTTGEWGGDFFAAARRKRPDLNTFRLSDSRDNLEALVSSHSPKFNKTYATLGATLGDRLACLF